MIEYDLKIAPESLELLRRMPDIMVPAMFKGMQEGMYEVEASVKLDYLSGQVLKRRTGHLARSIKGEARLESDRVIGIIGSTGVPYARIHEYGGVITPKKAKILRFQVQPGVWRSAYKVTIPPRPYLMPALVANLEKVGRLIGKEIEKAFEESS